MVISTTRKFNLVVTPGQRPQARPENTVGRFVGTCMSYDASVEVYHAEPFNLMMNVAGDKKQIKLPNEFQAAILRLE